METESPQPTFHLIYDENNTAIRVLKLYDSRSHELSNYVRASRKDWQVASDATQYGLVLAKDNGLRFLHDRSVDDDSYLESMLLD